MKKYPDNSKIYELKKKRRQEIEQLPPIERIRIAKRLQKLARAVPKRQDSKTPRDPSWSVASGRPKRERKLA